jgi:hypothetical protein
MAKFKPMAGYAVLVVSNYADFRDVMAARVLQAGGRIRFASCCISMRRHLQVYSPRQVILDPLLADYPECVAHLAHLAEAKASTQPVPITPKEYWVVKGEVTDPEAHPLPCKSGDVEWQFSDGPSGVRGSSADFLDLESGLAWVSGSIIHWEG